MWFVITQKSPAKFYSNAGDFIGDGGIEWANQVVIKNNGTFTRYTNL